MLFFFMTTESVLGGPPPAAKPDESLIPRIASGDKEALAALYRQTSASVFGFALSILKDRPAAEDVMQDTYLRIYAAAGSYKSQGKPMAWILTVVRNLSLMKLRERKGAGTPVEEIWEDPAPGDDMEASLDRMVLHAAMAVLDDEERQIVILHSITGLKHREIAGLMEMPLSTVLSKNRRALMKLRNKLEGVAK